MIFLIYCIVSLFICVFICFIMCFICLFAIDMFCCVSHIHSAISYSLYFNLMAFVRLNKRYVMFVTL